MKSPSVVRVRVDAQGRMVIPLKLREEITTTPGEVFVRRMPDGLMLEPATTPGAVETGPDGLPILRVGRAVTNDKVLAAIDRERSER